MYIITSFLVFAGFVINSDAVVQNFYWRDYIPGDIPCDAVKGAPGRYIGQINHIGHVIPATILSHNHRAVSNYGAKLVIEDDIKILCSPETHRIYWASVDFEKLDSGQMEGAMKGGYDGKLVYIGKIYNAGEWKISKAFAIDEPQKGLYVWNDAGHEFKFLQFQILKYNSTVAANNCSMTCSN